MSEKTIDNNSSTETTISIKSEDPTILSEPAAVFEAAISATGFGFFNILLLLITIPSVLASLSESSSLSFVFPAAQCDLNLSLEDKGVVNALIYTGMICSSFLWGPLIDVVGRRKVLVMTHFLDFICALTVALAQSYPVLVAAKFIGGFIINGQSMSLHPYLAEFHGTKIRSRVPLTVGLLFSLGNVWLPLLAWLILPLPNIKFNLIEYHAWNVFLFICAIPALISGIAFILMPETPRFLMTKGLNKKALEVFRKVYCLNTGNSKDEYPFNKLIEDNKQVEHKKKLDFKAAWKQISPVFSAKYATKLLLVCSILFSILFCVSTLRLWLPEIFQMTNDYEYYNQESASFCTMLSTAQQQSSSSAETCTVNFDNASVYINTMIIAITNVVGYLVAALVINKVGKKKILLLLELAAGLSIACIYFAPNSSVAVTLMCINLTCACVCIDVVITVIIDLFPTHLRASALSLAIMSSRIGSVMGNLLFPFLLQAGCVPPFVTFGCILIGCTVMSAFLPNTDMKALV